MESKAMGGMACQNKTFDDPLSHKLVFSSYRLLSKMCVDTVHIIAGYVA